MPSVAAQQAAAAGARGRGLPQKKCGGRARRLRPLRAAPDEGGYSACARGGATGGWATIHDGARTCSVRAAPAGDPGGRHSGWPH
jgi:hypothetical protein